MGSDRCLLWDCSTWVVHTDANNKYLYGGKTDHSHPPNPEYVQIKQTREKIKKRAVKELTPIRKIYDEEMAVTTMNSVAVAIFPTVHEKCYHNRLNSRICRNHPDVWDLINFMKGEEKRVERIKLQWPSGAPKPKNIRTIALQSRINTLYDRYKNYRIAASDLLNTFGKGNITNLIRNVLHSICVANDQSMNLRLDEFTRAGLMNCLDKSTKIFMADEADVAFVDAGLFSSFPKHSAENNCRCGSWDPIIGRSCWWVLDEPLIMEELIESVLDCSMTSVEQVAFACSLINNCTFKDYVDALSRVVARGNSMKQKSYGYRQDVSISSLIGKSVQHAHRLAAFRQIIEYGLDLCVEYADRFERFPSSGKIDHDFAERIEEIFQESFHKQTRVDKQLRQFFISDQVVVRAIDLVSGLVQQMKILLDGTNAPIWAASQARSLIVLSINDDRSFDTEKHEKKEKKKILVSHYVSTEKLQRIAMETVLYPSLCFTATQLHMNSLLHNAASSKIRCILEHLMKCDLLECVNKGVKTSRRFTNVCIQRLPICDHDEQMNTDYRSIFDEKLKEFKYSHSTFTLDEYFKKSMINIHVTGAVTDELIKFFSLPEYMMVELRPLYNLEETKNLKSTSAIQSHVNIQSNLVDNNVVLYNGNYQCNHHTTTDCSTLMTLHDDNDVSYIVTFDVVQNVDMHEDTAINHNIYANIMHNDRNDNLGNNTVVDNSICVDNTNVIYSQVIDDLMDNESNIKNKKRKHIGQQDPTKKSNIDADMTFSFPPAWRLRSKTRSNHHDEHSIMSITNTINREKKKK
ncbi:unnamed protein product [Rotaria magnacalcarata]|uniref:Uncharacterized protein n=1 Tax=Rotaria magnacalcarata TaxID=392030 RepID=A0A816N1X1_9BILA|nr:unnamed protein product [Rotaria magnacalcarata]